MTTLQDTTTEAQESQSYKICSDLMLKVLVGSKLSDVDNVHLIQVLWFVLLAEKNLGGCAFLTLLLSASAKTDQYLEIMERQIQAVVNEKEQQQEEESNDAA